MNMMSSVVSIKLVDTPDDAPKYKDDWTIVKIEDLIIVGKGMEGRKPSIDIQLKDKDGNKFLIMTTGAIMEAIGKAAEGKRLQGMN